MIEGALKNKLQIKTGRQKLFDNLLMNRRTFYAGEEGIGAEKILFLKEIFLRQQPAGVVGQDGLVMCLLQRVLSKFGNPLFGIVRARQRCYAQKMLLVPRKRDITAGILFVGCYFTRNTCNCLADFLILADNFFTFSFLLCQHFCKILLAALSKIFLDGGDADVERTQVDDNF